MKTRLYYRSSRLAWLFIKEQLKEPISLFWIIISPCAAFYLLALSRGRLELLSGDYTEHTAWFYAYISSSVALFGFSFYIIGRRESGYIRSFIYNHEAKLVFILAQTLAYSVIAIIYCSVFYLATRLPFGAYSLLELLNIISKFYICYLLFCSIGIFFSLLPINFQNTNTLFSIFSFCTLILGISNSLSTNFLLHTVNLGNPLVHATELIKHGLQAKINLTLSILPIFISSLLIAIRFLRINPIWSRY
ncbi:ABC transporter permease [Pseudomonas gingeri]|uniref:ABC transporter permease n=1 Tax=Pseudomonas gingeri TaxID=117681 RepID=UPI0015A205B4|nr:ABC transporter permease [Pseudomonas gingeri]NWA03853.1 ABC transporter permease [Pseudomonas gingeri]NWA12743.1 ABC transporter permease [Pseudomonas gingeri]NWA58840.1 ABC transporter permease [Pseudomonas gingeri]NWA94394.1 ABC transporter permease [Pseudomonas gingeri]NWB01050.1 ABC transporter permease [Pseudomonas gingeri]